MGFCDNNYRGLRLGGGQYRAEQVDRIKRNEWTESSGMGGQSSPEYAPIIELWADCWAIAIKL